MIAFTHSFRRKCGIFLECCVIGKLQLPNRSGFTDGQQFAMLSGPQQMELAFTIFDLGLEVILSKSQEDLACLSYATMLRSTPRLPKVW